VLWIIKILKPIAKALLGATVLLVIVSVYAPHLAPEIPFLPITGLIELIESAEKEAASILPEEVKGFIGRLSEAVA